MRRWYERPGGPVSAVGPAAVGNVGRFRGGSRVGVCSIGLAALVLSSACSGGSAGPGVAGASSTTGASSSGKTSTLTFAPCMRSHGIPNFPDSDVFGPGSDIDPNSPQFQAAYKVCRSLEPQGQAAPGQPAAFRAALVRFSACVRAHGVPDFPDPGGVPPSGSVTTIFGISLPSTIDPQSPVFQAAVKTCQSVLPGGGPKGPPKQSVQRNGP